MSHDIALPEIDFDGNTYRLGTLLPAGFPDTLPKLSSAPGYRRWSKPEIEEAIRKKPVKRRQQFAGPNWVVNQLSRGSCNPCAAVGMSRRSMALGGRNDVPMLSWEFVYAQLVDGNDQGSMLDDGMLELQRTGAPVLNPARHPINAHIRKRDYSAEEMAEAQANRAVNCFVADDEIDLATLVLSGQGAAVVAVHVGNSFTRLDAKGFCGASGGPGNHAVGAQDAEIIDGELAFDMPNSWGLNFGDNGHGYLSWRRHMAGTVKYHRFYAILAATNPGDGAPSVKE